MLARLGILLFFLLLSGTVGQHSTTHQAAAPAAAEASDNDAPRSYSMRLVPSHRRELQTLVSTVADLTSALANTAVARIVLASGTYLLTAELSITRSVILEAAAGATVTLDAQGFWSPSPRRVVNINPGSSGVVQLIGLGITGGYIDSVCAHVQKLPSPLWESC